MRSDRQEHGPPRAAELLLRLVLPDAVAREGLLGDLEEEYQARRRIAGAGGAFWYWSIGLRLIFRYGWEHLRRAAKLLPAFGKTPQGETFMNALLQDLRFALRSLSGSYGFTAVAVLTLAIAIGATTAMFSMLNAVLMQPLPYEAPERLVLARTTFEGQVNWTTSAQDYNDFREMNRSFESLACLTSFTLSMTATGLAEPERVETQMVSWDLFRTLRADPYRGRHFRSDEGRLGAPQVAMISYPYWQKSLGGDPEAIGTALILDGTPHTVVGVMPSGFRFLADVDVWRIYRLGGSYAGGRQYHNWMPIGRLKPGVTIEQAQKEFDVISANLQASYPETNQNKAMLLSGLQEALVQNFRPSLLVLMAAVALVLLIACGNVANLLLARGAKRQTELAVRAAMGAGRARLLRQLLTESLAIALLSGCAGLLLALLFQRGILQAVPLQALGISQIGLNLPMLAFALGASLLTSLLFGAIPALRTAPSNLSDHLKAGARGGQAGGGARLRSGFVVLQVALSLVLLIGSGLLIRSFASLTGADPGFDPRNLLSAEIRLPASEYPPEQRVPLYTRLLENVRALPGVSGAALINQLPIRDPGNNIYVYDARQPPVSPSESLMAYTRSVMPGYFEAMRIPLLAGRGIRPSDTLEGPPVLVINQAMADALFPDENPLGQRVVITGRDPDSYEVVGVAGNVRISSLASGPTLAMYGAYYQSRLLTMRLAVRSAGDPALLAGALRSAIRELDRNIPVAELDTMESIIAASSTVVQSRTATTSLALFAAIALLLATTGLYSLLAYYVNRRTHEIGIRMALGAGGGKVLQLILGRGLSLVAIGLAVGLAGALAATRLLAQQLYGVGQTDPITYLSASLLFVLVAVLACLIPAWRASRVDPLIALQAE